MNLIINMDTKHFHISTMETLGKNEIIIKNYDTSNIDLKEINLYEVNETLNGIILNQNQLEKYSIAHLKSRYLEIFNTKLKELDYDSIATVVIWKDDVTFGTEATRIMDWYKALITKNYVILNDAKASGVIPTDEEYLAEIAKVIF